MADLVTDASRRNGSRRRPAFEDGLLPPGRTRHLLTMTDDVGIIQHADGSLPNRSTGYCVDDVARLGMVAQRLSDRSANPQWNRILQRSLAFLRDAHTPGEPGLRNFMGYDRRWLDEPHHGDHVGRAMWAVGDVLARESSISLVGPTRMLFDELVWSLSLVEPTIRTATYSILGLARPDAALLSPSARGLLSRFVSQLSKAADDAGPDWMWFEPTLTYDNARLCQALIIGGLRLDDVEAVDIGLQTLRWYGDECGLALNAAEPVVLIGNEWRHRGQPHPGGGGDEQPLDAAALVEAEVDALVATGEPTHARRALRAFEWFHGRNHLGVPVYDYANGGCHDGLKPAGLNPNQGAESTLAYHHALLMLDAAGLPVLSDRRLAA